MTTISRPATVSRPNTPRRVVLTANAKYALTSAEPRDGGYWYVTNTWCRMETITAELAELHLVDDMGPANRHGQRWVLTENGLRMRSYLQHQSRLRKLAEQVRTEGITGEDLPCIAADIDARLDTGEIGEINGCSMDFALAYALTASLSDQSAEDLRQDLETYMGWR